MAKRFEVFHIKNTGEGKKSFWTRIGSAWENRNGSINVVLDTIPLDGKMTIQEPREREPGAEG